MRDLKADLDICNKATPGPWTRNEKPSFGDWWVCSGGQHICLLPADKKGTYYGEMFRANSDFIAQAREGWPYALERAIKAEAEVERLQKVYAITNESWKKQVEELTLLRKVAEAAKQFMNELDLRSKTHSLDMSNYHGRTIHIKQGESGKPYWLALWSLEQALAELDKEDTHD